MSATFFYISHPLFSLYLKHKTKNESLWKEFSSCLLLSLSQGMDDIYEGWHDAMERFRGAEFHCKRAEAFVHLRRNDSDIFEK